MATKKPSKALDAQELAESIIHSFDSEFHSASDRSFAVLGAAYMDSILEQLLGAAFVADREATDRLLGTAGPIGSNGAKYSLAYSLGLITRSERDDLKTIADIRNHFAHKYSASTFTADDRVRDLVRKMHFAKRRAEFQSQSSTEPNDGRLTAGSTRTDSRVLFRDAVVEFLVTLLPRIRDVRRAEASMWYGTA